MDSRTSLCCVCGAAIASALRGRPVGEAGRAIGAEDKHQREGGLRHVAVGHGAEWS